MSFNKLKAAEAERLALLAEECAEVIQVIGKILRHGYESYNPYDATKTTNRGLLEKELGDVMAARVMMERKGDIICANVLGHRQAKLKSVKKWMHYT